MKVISLENPAKKENEKIYSKINFERDLFINIVGNFGELSGQILVNISADPHKSGAHFGSIGSRCFTTKYDHNFDEILTEFSIRYLDLFNRKFISVLNEETINDVLDLVLLSLKYDFEEDISIFLTENLYQY